MHGRPALASTSGELLREDSTKEQAGRGCSRDVDEWRVVEGGLRDKRKWAKGEEEVDHGDNTKEHGCLVKVNLSPN